MNPDFLQPDFSQVVGSWSLWLLGWGGLIFGVGIFGIGLVCLVVAFMTQNSSERAKNFRFSGILLVLGLLTFMVGLGSCGWILGF